MNSIMTRVRAAIRQAIGRITPKPVDTKLLQMPTELQKALRPYRHAPQWLRLALLYRLTKRQYRKRRLGDSAKSPAANRKHGTARLTRVVGLGSYDSWKAEQAAARAASRSVHTTSP